jgi:hypothetical protein
VRNERCILRVEADDGATSGDAALHCTKKKGKHNMSLKVVNDALLV